MSEKDLKNADSGTLESPGMIVTNLESWEAETQAAWRSNLIFTSEPQAQQWGWGQKQGHQVAVCLKWTYIPGASPHCRENGSLFCGESELENYWVGATKAQTEGGRLKEVVTEQWDVSSPLLIIMKILAVRYISPGMTLEDASLKNLSVQRLCGYWWLEVSQWDSPARWLCREAHSSAQTFWLAL